MAPSEATRTALWERAGMVRTRAGLEGLLDEPHPLARLVARFALARPETRGCHVRADHPATEPGWDGRHLAVERGEPPEPQLWS
jgi:L-aspartate oxidase